MLFVSNLLVSVLKFGIDTIKNRWYRINSKKLVSPIPNSASLEKYIQALRTSTNFKTSRSSLKNTRLRLVFSTPFVFGNRRRFSNSCLNYNVIKSLIIHEENTKEITTVVEVLNRQEICVDTLTLIFLLLRRFTLKITSPINSEDHSFYTHIKRLAVRPLSDPKLAFRSSFKIG